MHYFIILFDNQKAEYHNINYDTEVIVDAAF